MSHTFYAIEQFVLRDFRIRYRNMSLGMFWSLLNPLVMVATYSFVFTKVFRNDSIRYFPLYLLIGILCFNYFNLAWVSATYSITANAGLVKRVRVPREVIPISAVLANGIHFLLQFVLVLAFTFWLGVPIGSAWLWLPFLVVLLMFAISGISLLTSSLDVYFRDTRYLVESTVLVLFWLTPVVYSEKMIPSGYLTFFLLNPVTDVVIAMRQIILEQRNPDPVPLLYALAVSCFLFTVGAVVFAASKKRFADHL